MQMLELESCSSCGLHVSAEPSGWFCQDPAIAPLNTQALNHCTRSGSQPQGLGFSMTKRVSSQEPCKPRSPPCQFNGDPKNRDYQPRSPINANNEAAQLG